MNFAYIGPSSVQKILIYWMFLVYIINPTSVQKLSLYIEWLVYMIDPSSSSSKNSSYRMTLIYVYIIGSSLVQKIPFVY